MGLRLQPIMWKRERDMKGRILRGRIERPFCNDSGGDFPSNRAPCDIWQRNWLSHEFLACPWSGCCVLLRI